MAGHLATAGCPLPVCNGTAAKVVVRVAEHGGESFAPPGEATAGAEFVLGCMFPTRGAVIRDDAFLCGLITWLGRRNDPSRSAGRPSQHERARRPAPIDAGT